MQSIRIQLIAYEVCFPLGKQALTVQGEHMHDDITMQESSDDHHRRHSYSSTAGAAAGWPAPSGFNLNSGTPATAPPSGQVNPEGPVHVFHSNNSASSPESGYNVLVAPGPVRQVFRSNSSNALTSASPPEAGQNVHAVPGPVRFMDPVTSSEIHPAAHTARPRPALSRQSAAPVVMHAPTPPEQAGTAPGACSDALPKMW